MRVPTRRWQSYGSNLSFKEHRRNGNAMGPERRGYGSGDNHHSRHRRGFQCVFLASPVSASIPCQQPKRSSSGDSYCSQRLSPQRSIHVWAMAWHSQRSRAVRTGFEPRWAVRFGKTKPFSLLLRRLPAWKRRKPDQGCTHSVIVRWRSPRNLR